MSFPIVEHSPLRRGVLPAKRGILLTLPVFSGMSVHGIEERLRRKIIDEGNRPAFSEMDLLSPVEGSHHLV